MMDSMNVDVWVCATAEHLPNLGECFRTRRADPAQWVYLKTFLRKSAVSPALRGMLFPLTAEDWHEMVSASVDSLLHRMMITKLPQRRRLTGRDWRAAFVEAMERVLR